MAEHQFRVKERPGGGIWDVFDRYASKGGQIVFTGREADCFKFAVSHDTRELGVIVQFWNELDGLVDTAADPAT